MTEMNDMEEMCVIKRSGNKETIAFDKILNRLRKLGTEAGLTINYTNLAIKVIDQLHEDIATSQIDELAAQQCASMITVHPDYGILAGRIVVSNHQKNTFSSFKDAMHQLYTFRDIHGKASALISKSLWEVADTNAEAIEARINYDRDYLIDYFGFKTLERAYLMSCDGKIVERPQHMWMRVSLGIHGSDIKRAFETYDLMSQKYFTHATPTLFNAGTPRPQLSSCYLVGMENDSIRGIYNTLQECALISKWAGGIGLHIHNIRATGSHIRGTNGTSNGLVPMLRVFNDTARYVDQGGNKRNGSFAIYLEPWHRDIESFLNLKKNHGDEEQRARDLFYALWIPSLFMERVKSNAKWTLLCPDECPGLSDVHSEEFEKLYTSYEEKFANDKNTINARDLWLKILDSQMETGTPYLVFKDSANKKSNQQNLGTIKSSNLCSEIIEYSSASETAVCNLASISLGKFVSDTNPPTFDYSELHRITCVVARNLDRVIDINYYPTPKTKRSNLLHRPIGIGVQGLADAFMLLDIPFSSDEARVINKRIFETIYHAAIETSCNISKERKEAYNSFLKSGGGATNDYPLITNCFDCDSVVQPGPDVFLKEELACLECGNDKYIGAYSSFAGSPASNGILQFDMWGASTDSDLAYDWATLKTNIKEHGLRNSLSIAPMPTASTSQILGNNECFEPITSNIYSRRTLAGDFVVANKYLLRELISLGMWNKAVKDNIVANRGSVQQITSLPEHVRNKYRTVWEIPMRHLIDMATERGAFICQSQSLNLWIEDPTYNTLTSMHFYSWKSGLKTGIYYLRRKPKHQPQQFTVEPDADEKSEDEIISNGVNDAAEEACEMCSG